jgi:hypothetical protein
MDFPTTTLPSVPAEYYRRLAARVRLLMNEATTPAIKGRLHVTAREYERLAAHADKETPPVER